MSKPTQVLTAVCAILFAAEIPANAQGDQEGASLPTVKEEVLEEQIQALSSSDRLKQLRARSELVQIGKPAVQPLIAALTNSNPLVRMSAAGALGDIGDPRAVTPLIDALNEDRIHIRMAIPAFRKMGKPAVQPLISALKDETTDRRRIMQVLAMMRDPAFNELIDALEDKNSRVRAGVALALGGMRDKRAAKPLVALLNDEDFQVQLAATMALQKLGPAAIPQLVDALQDEKTRIAAATALGKVGDARAIEPLIAMLGAQDQIAQIMSATALQTITGQDFGPDQQKWQQWWTANKDKISKTDNKAIASDEE